MKHILAVGKAYKGTVIFTAPEGVFIVREDGTAVPFLDEAEAQAHVDAAETLYRETFSPVPGDDEFFAELFV